MNNNINQEERKSMLMHEVMSLRGKKYGYDEIQSMLGQVRRYEEEGSFTVIDKRTRDEEIEILLDGLSSSEKNNELAWVLGIFTAYNMKADVYLKYFAEETTEGIIERISSHEAYECDVELQKENCNIILDALGFNKTMEIIDDADLYISLFIKLDIIVDTMRDKLYRSFAKLD